MNCIKCGREIPEGELFCEVCAMPSAVPAAPAPPAEPKRKKKPKKQRAKKAVDQKTVRRLRIALAVAVCLTLVVSLFSVMGIRQYLKRTEDLRIREASVTLREKEADNRDNQIAELKAELSEAQELIRGLERALEQAQEETQ